MKMLRLAWSNLLYKPMSSLLCWIGLSVSAGIISVLLIFQYNFEKQFEKNIEGIDMVLGAKGSPLQLILSAIFHIDAPTGNIPYQEAQKWMSHPYVEKAIPLAYGDSYEGTPIIGTTPALLQHYQVNLRAGKTFSKNFEVVLGANLAQRLQLKIGSQFFSTHGNDEHGEQHTHQAYTVSGILSASGTVIDNLIIGNIESVWKIHEHEEHDHHNGNDDHHDDEKDKELTAVLLKFRNPMGLIQMPRIINEQTSMMAAIPAIETNRLFSLFGIGISVLKNIGLGVMILSALIIFVSLYNSLKERKYELALMRTVGIPRFHILWSLLTESLMLGISGILTGLLLSRITLLSLSASVQQNYYLRWEQLWKFIPGETTLAIATLALVFLAAFIPALRIWSINISKTLAHR